MNHLYVKIKNEMYLSEDFTNEEVVTLTLLNRTFNEARGISIITIEYLVKCLYCKTNNQRIITTIKNALISLYDKGVIKNVYDIHYDKVEICNIKKDDIITLEIEQVKSEYFEVKDLDIDKVAQFCSTTNIDKFSLLRYAIAISRVVNNESGFGYLTQGSCKKIIGSHKSIKKYNEILDELKIFRHTSDYVTPIKEYVSTFFGRYEDKSNFDTQLKYIIQERKLIKIDKTDANNKRREYIKAKLY